MGRTGYYIKGGKRPTIPAVWFAVVLRPRQTGVSGMPDVTRQEWGSADLAVTRRTRTGWTYPETAIVSTPEAMRDWMDERHVVGRTNWVITPDVMQTLTLSHWWQHAEEKGIQWRDSSRNVHGAKAVNAGVAGITLISIATTASCGIVGFREDGISWRWVSGSNYRIVESVSHGNAESDGSLRSGDRPAQDWYFQPRGLSGPSAILARIVGYCQWWRETASVGWSCTIGQLAYGILRSTAAKGSIATHGDEAVHRLERQSAYGGRASCWYYGRIETGSDHRTSSQGATGRNTSVVESGPVTQIDIRGMYPSLLRDRMFPTRLISYRNDIIPRELDSLIDSHGVIAHVTIDTRRAEYPYRNGDRILYPVGRFTTTLTGVELCKLRPDGAVLTVHSAAIYQLSNAFHATAQLMLANRDCTASATDAHRYTFAKLLSNSIAGKLAQRAGKWCRDSDHDSPGKWGESYELDLATGEQIRRRHIAGMAYRWTDDVSGRGPHTAAFAYLAAYGRVLMREIRDRLPQKSVVSQDTDGLWILPSGMSALGTVPAKDGVDWGQYGIVGSARTAQWYGPRHYQIDGTWVLSGFQSPKVDIVDRTVWHTYSPSVLQRRMDSAPFETFQVARKSQLRLELDGQTIGSDGWAIPQTIYPAKEYPDKQV